MATDSPPNDQPDRRDARAGASSMQSSTDAEVRDEDVLVQQARITDLFGSVDYDATFDCKRQRRRRRVPRRVSAETSSARRLR